MMARPLARPELKTNTEEISVRILALIGFVAGVGACVLISGAVSATTTQTFGDGSAVEFVDRSATFDGLDYLHNGTPLSDYTEDMLKIGTEGDSFTGEGPSVQPYANLFHIPMDPATQAFYYPYGGNSTWVTIEATDQKKIYALEFLYGNGMATGDLYSVPWGNTNGYVDWQTLSGGSIVSSGQIGPNPILPLATVLGFTDPNGFDQLQVMCRIGGSSHQALALDNLKVQMTPVPEPSTLLALGSALGIFAAMRRKHRS